QRPADAGPAPASAFCGRWHAPAALACHRHRHYPSRMRGQPRVLYNTTDVELWPHGLLRARSNHDARALARARHVLRRQRDGRCLAAVLPEGVLPLVPRLPREPGIDEALDLLDALCAVPPANARDFVREPGKLPLGRLQERLGALGLDEAGYARRT